MTKSEYKTLNGSRVRWIQCIHVPGTMGAMLCRDSGIWIQRPRYLSGKSEFHFAWKNGKGSPIKITRHINIRYFFIINRFDTGEMPVKYCLTEGIFGDFSTMSLHQVSKVSEHHSRYSRLIAAMPTTITRVCWRNGSFYHYLFSSHIF